jgi:nucleotide-binding universal stress UspA family protein
MTIAVVHSATPPGHAALLAGAHEALLRLEDLVIAVAAGSGPVTVEQIRQQLGPTANQLDEQGLTIGIGRSQLSDPSDAVVQIAQENDARLLVLGLRRRTPVGKLIMGSLAQRILLEATCPVLAVKA